MYQGEKGYLELLDHIMTHGVDRGDRTKTGTRSIFHANLGFNLWADGFPVLTTKKLFWKGVMGELLWFLSGRTDLDSLRKFTYGKDKDQKTIWDIDYARWHRTGDRYVPENEGGNLYGKQWRHFTSNWNGGIAIDQIKWVLEEAKRNPESRRLIVNAWNAADVAHETQALPCCHFAFQLYIEDGKLNLKWNQRSVDYATGCPFNIASYAMLTHIFAHWLDLEAGYVIGDLTNVHIYNNHFDAVREQLLRSPLPLCKAPIIPSDFTLDTMHQFTALDFPLINYQSHPSICLPFNG